MTTSRRQIGWVLAALLAACGGSAKSGGSGGGGAGGGGGGSVTGIAAPKEVSALPTKDASGGGVAGFVRVSSALASDPGTDYSQAETFKFVDEQALSQFDTLNTIFKALAQTHYADAENVGQGPYGAMVDWDDKGGSTTGKQLVPWVVDSSMGTDDQGRSVNKVQVWMQMNMGDGQLHVIKVELDLYAAPTQNADGSYSDYGVWTINAKFDPLATGYFVASAGHDANGRSLIMIHQMDPGSAPTPQETRGILVRSESSGYGAVSYPDWNSCHDPSCVPSTSTVTYAYNADHVALDQDGAVVFKDRTSVVDLVNRYGLYDAATGEDVTKSHSFGFPVNYVDDQGHQHWGYYGAWQGRHQLGYDGMNQIPEGATVTRADLPPNAPAQTFTASAPFTGTLVKRTLVAGDIQGIKDVVVQTFVNKNFPLGFDGTQWVTCPAGQWLNMGGMYPNLGTPVCVDPAGAFGSNTSAPAPFTDFASLVLNPNDPQRQVMINLQQQCAYPCNVPPPMVYLVYDGTQFDETNWTPGPGPMTQPTSNGTAYVPQAGDQLWVNVGGPIYIAYDGAGFVQKTVLSFDQQTFTPTFDPNGDVSYALDLGREYYFSTPGVNYVVKATAPDTYDVKVELQSVANPVNASTFVPAGITFHQQWDPNTSSTTCTSSSVYAFDAPSMKLVYACVSDSDQANGATFGGVVSTGQWGLVAFDGGVSTGVQYNWDYPQANQPGNFGTQQYLVRADGSYVILEDPIRLASIQLANHAGDLLTLSLQFDGNWVNGLPDVYNELSNNGFVLTQAIADKVVVIPAGTEVVDANDATKHYVFKPLQMNEYLSVIADPRDVDASAASSLDLSTVPTFVDAHLGALPNVPIKYSEGKLVQ